MAEAKTEDVTQSTSTSNPAISTSGVAGTPLDQAQLRQLISDKGSKVITDTVDKYRRNLLHLCAQKGDTNTLKFLLEALVKDHSEKEDFHKIIDGLDKKQKTALHYACQEGFLDTAQVLLDHGSNPNTRNIGGQTPFHYAAFRGHLDLIKLLQSKGANINEKNIDGQTALHYACQSGQLPTVQYLIQQKLNVNALTNDHSLPIHFAVAYQHVNLVAFLLEQNIVIPSTVFDTETSPEIDELLIAYSSFDRKEKLQQKKSNLTISIPTNVQHVPSVLQTPITPITPAPFGDSGPIFPVFPQ